jgi:ribosomal-protein-alanine N-acetyltransferase
MGAADLALVAAFERSLYGFPWSLGNFRDSLDAGYDCWVACAGGQVIGYAILMVAMNEAHLLNLAVASPYHNRGIGRTFLDFMLGVARQAKCEIVYLEVRPSNLAARHLYRKAGFQQIAIRPAYYPAIAGREDALFLGITL